MTTENEEKVLPKDCYLQRDGESLVLRAHISGGLVGKEEIAGLTKVLQRFPDLKLRLTTRQNFRFYGKGDAWVAEAKDILHQHGFEANRPSMGIAVNACHGLNIHETVDPWPYAQALMQWLDDKNGWAGRLPGKFKVSIADSAENLSNISYADMAFILKAKADGIVADVYGGGSLGAQARTSFRLVENLPTEELLRAMDAMAKVFSDLFADSNVGKKRMRFKIRGLGEAAFADLFHEAFAAMPKHPYALPEIVEKNRSWAKETECNHPLLYATKYAGIYSVKLPKCHGFLTLDTLLVLHGFLQNVHHEVELAADSDQTLVVRDLNGDEAEALVQSLSEAALLDRHADVVACVGTEHCRFGLANSLYLSAVLDELTHLDLPPIQVSGCMNSCAAQQMAHLGFWGKRGDVAQPDNDVFAMTVGGLSLRSDRLSRLAKAVGDISVAEIRAFLPLLSEAKVQSAKDWAGFMAEDYEVIVTIYEKVHQK